MFQGSIVAMVTPFAEGRIDLAALKEDVAFQISGGTSGLVPIGTTGESPVLTPAERADILRTVVREAKGKAPVIAGTGTNDTRTTIEHTKAAEELGADAVLVVTPYYNRPSQEGLYRHYEAVAKSTKLPVCLYNVPGRTGVNLLPETVARLAKIRNVAAIKEASGSIEQAARVRALCDITVLSGDDALTLPLMTQGAAGVISVAANIVPREMSGLCAAAAGGDLPRARALHKRLQALWKALFLETNPVPVKTAMKLLGRGTGEVRLPLCEMSAANEEKLKRALASFTSASRRRRSDSGSKLPASGR